MACLMGIGIITTLVIAEPDHPVSGAAGELESEVGRKLGLEGGNHMFARLTAWLPAPW